jgi:hypothetical protein
MNDVVPIERIVNVGKSGKELQLVMLVHLAAIKGRIVESHDSYIKCKFGSLLVSRLIGEFFVPRATLPKMAEIHLSADGDHKTRVKIVVSHTHKYGVKWGYVKKYEKALQELLDAIVQFVN